MAASSAIFNQTRKALTGATSRLMSFRPIRAGVEDATMFFGFGKSTIGVFGRKLDPSEYSYGLFNPMGYEVGGRNLGKTYSALRGKGFSRSHSMRGAAKGLGRGFRRASWGGRAMFAGKTALRGAGPALLGYSAYQGWKEGGAVGAAKNVAIDTAISFGMMAGLSALGVSAGAAAAVAVPVSLVAGAGYAGYSALNAGVSANRKARQLEMGNNLVDPFGTAATMRARSLQQLMTSQVNGRSAFGSEASLMHVPIMR